MDGERMYRYVRPVSKLNADDWKDYHRRNKAKNRAKRKLRRSDEEEADKKRWYKEQPQAGT